MSCLLLYWEAADWSRIGDLIRAGRMPHLAGLIETGVAGRLNSPPPLDPWGLATTLACGQIAVDHGIAGHWQLTPDKSIRPPSSSEIQVPTLWRMVTSGGRTAATLNWPLTYPASRGNGLVVSEPFVQTRRRHSALRPVPERAVVPAILTDALATLRCHADELPPGVVERAAGCLDQEAGTDGPDRTQRLGSFCVLLAGLITITRVTRELLHRQQPDLMTVRFSGLDVLTRLVDQPTAPATGLLDLALEHFDQALGLLLERLGAQTRILIVSAHRARTRHDDPNDPTRCREPRGFLVANGPGVRPQARVLGASLLDLAPTVLRLLDLQPGSDMPGRALSELFEAVSGGTPIQTWNSCRISSSERPDFEVLDGLALEAACPAPANPQALQRYRVASRSAALSSLGRHREALAELDLLAEDDDPVLLRLRVHLLLDQEHIDHDEISPLLRNFLRQGGSAFDYHLLKARLAARQKLHDQALQQLFSCLARHPDQALVHLYIGREYKALGKRNRALQAFSNAIEIQPDLLPARLALAELHLDEGQPEAALEQAWQAVELRFNSTRSHELLARSLAALGRDEEAAEAFQASLRLNSGLISSHQALVRLYHEDRLARPDLQRHHQDLTLRLLAARAISGR